MPQPIDDKRLSSEAGPVPIPLKSSASRFGPKHVLLAFAIAMNCRTFQFFPGMQYVQELWFVICFLFLLLAYRFWKSKDRCRLSGFELYLLLLMVTVPILGALCALSAYGQPAAYGLLAERSVALFGFVIAVSYAIRRGILRIKDVERSLLFLSWGTLVLYTAMQLFLKPKDFADYGIGFVTEPGDLARFKFQMFFTVFGFLYYVFQGFRKGSATHYAISLLFLMSAIGKEGGRSLTVSLVLTVLLLLYRWGGTEFLFKTLPKFITLVLFVGTVWYLSDSQMVFARYQKFSDAFQVALTGADVEDDSAASRVAQAVIAVPHIAERPFFGSGLISNQWQREEEKTVGEFYSSVYFFPQDIGVIGALYVYGAFGLLLFGWQYRFALTAVAEIPRSYYAPLLDATKGLLLFSAFYSVTGGMFVFNVEVTLFFIMLLGGICLEFQGNKPAPGLASCRA